MIHPLIDQIIAELQDGFDGEFANIENRIAAGPINQPDENDPLPVIAVYPGDLEVARTVRELNSSQPRPQEIREEISIDETTPAGPYPMAKRPLGGSVYCQVIYDLGEVAEKSQLLVGGKDFIVNAGVANPSITFKTAIKDADVFRLTYSYVGVFSVKEFTQQFHIDIYESDTEAINKWVSIALAVLLTNHDELLEAFNATQYQVNAYAANLSLSLMEWLNGDYITPETVPLTRLTFHAKGQIKTVREITSGFGLIEKIHSPGVTSDHAVDIDPNLG